MAGIMDFFRGASVPQDVAGNSPDAAAQKFEDAKSGTPPAFSGNQLDPANAPNAATPLAEFSKLWQIDSAAKQELDGPLFQMDNAKLQESVKAMEFAPTLSAEHIQQLANGDPAILQKALNASAQNTFLKMIEVAQKMIEHGVNTSNSRMESKLPDRFKSFQAQDAISNDPILNNEAMKPVVEALQAQFRQKYPQASTSQVVDMTKRYLTQLGQTVTPQTQSDRNEVLGNPGRQAGSADFNNFFN